MSHDYYCLKSVCVQTYPFVCVFIIQLTSSHHDIPRHVYYDVTFVVLLQNLPLLVFCLVIF